MKRRAEFGDFQTPIGLAREVCALIARTGFTPASVLEPTCGTGAFLVASLEIFPGVRRALGFDINLQHLAQAQQAVGSMPTQASVEIRQADFFLTNWTEIVEELPEPMLVIGNPPWVTNAALGVLGSDNLPVKSNLDRLRGMDALTGKSNFDISEWMLRKSIEWLERKHGLLAVLCKTTVARKILSYAWQNGVRIGSSAVYALDARNHFGVSVDACLLIVRSNSDSSSQESQVFSSLYANHPDRTFGLQDGMLVADVVLYQKRREFLASGFKGWRSGIKHDCRQVFELHVENGNLVNGLGETVEIEPSVVFPSLKSSDLIHQRSPRLWMIVPQRTMNDSLSRLQAEAPRAWNYLSAHAHLLDKRKSAVYENRSPVSVFGVGPYSFAPWKVAISGLHKKLEFVRVPPFQGRPVMLDDTGYLFPCWSEEESNLLYELVMSEPAREFWSSLVFWDAKRPITAQLLNSLDLMALARCLGKERAAARLIAKRQISGHTENARQRFLFGEEIT